MRKAFILVTFLVIAATLLFVTKQISDTVYVWVSKTYSEPTALYLTIVEFRFLELSLSSFAICYAFNSYFYLSHRNVLKRRRGLRGFIPDFTLPPVLMLPLFLINQIVFFMTKNFIVVPSYMRTINSLYTSLVSFLCISSVIIRHVYNLEWKMIDKTLRYLLRYFEHVVIYVGVGFVVYAFLTILVVNTAYMSIARTVMMRSDWFGVLATLSLNGLEALVLYFYFSIFLEPFINDVKLDAVMKRYA